MVAEEEISGKEPRSSGGCHQEKALEDVIKSPEKDSHQTVWSLQSEGWGSSNLKFSALYARCHKIPFEEIFSWII